ncbi:MAG: hypothetical protein H0X24_16830 [Ktedonobacterales bacterium]|nr:hypothetical protein [Ktedonobacterales bacterium]
MSKTTLRNLSLIGLAGVIIGFVFFGLSAVGATASTTVDASGSTTLSNITGGNPALALVGILLLVAAGIVSLIAWIGGLIRTAQLQRWGWFVPMLIFGSIVTLIWSFAGNDTPNAPTFQNPQYPPQPPMR